MYYEVYLDVLFVLNVMMDYFLLRLVGRLLQISVRPVRSFLGACMGAAGVCLLTIYPLTSWMNMILAYFVINTFMVRFGCNLKKMKDLIWGSIFLYGVGFLMGGLMELLRRITGTEGVRNFLMISSVSYLILWGSLTAYKGFRKQMEKTFRFQLYVNGRCREGTALLDTGNSLRDTISKKPVCIGGMQLLEGMLTEEMIQGLKAFSKGADAQICFEKLNPHFIPFTSLGCAGGLALAVTMDYLCLENQKVHKVIIRPVIAFSGENNSFSGDYQMILHPNLVDS